VQIVLGKRFTPPEIAELSALFNTWVGGLFTVAPFDLPFLPFGKALRAREVRVWPDWRRQGCGGGCGGPLTTQRAAAGPLPRRLIALCPRRPPGPAGPRGPPAGGHL
jgi:hypothetical protein